MNKKMKIFIICTIFTLISSCKIDTTGKDLKQSAKEQVQGFVDKILDPIEDRITSNGPIADELAKKLQEEEEKVNYGEGENEKAVDSGEELKEDKEENEQVANLEEKEEKNAKEDEEVVNLGGKEAEVKKETGENKEKIEKQKQEDKKTKKGKKKKASKQKQQDERKREREEQKRKRQERAKESKAKNKIKKLTDKIDVINGNIDDIESQTTVKPKQGIDKITGPVYDYFTDDNKKAIYKTWGDLEEEDNEGLGKLLKELSDARDKLRTKLNEDNKTYDGYGVEPPLKKSVKVSEIKEDLQKIKSGLEEVKGYLENGSNFEEIKGYIENSNSE